MLRDERNPGVALRRDEFLVQPDTRTIVAEIMLHTFLSWTSFRQSTQWSSAGVEEGDEERWLLGAVGRKEKDDAR